LLVEVVEDLDMLEEVELVVTELLFQEEQN
jgi:hypothetical protein